MLFWLDTAWAIDGPLLAGCGWLKTLPCWLPLLRRRINRQHRNKRPISNAAAATEPTTIPAIAPPESPPSEEESDVGVLVAVEVEVGSTMVDVMVGSTTFAHISSDFEL